MLIIGNTLVSLDILQEEFICNLEHCKGACCVEGDAGAPLLTEEVNEIGNVLPRVKKYMTGEATHLLATDGFYETDTDGDLVTKCLNGKDCIFAFRENGIYSCAIEKAALNHSEPSFLKPLSCHLYPIRLSPVGEYTALNYHRWEICSPACALGKSKKMPVYKFLKQPLIRAFGEEWYAELETVAEEYLKTVK